MPWLTACFIIAILGQLDQFILYIFYFTILFSLVCPSLRDQEITLNHDFIEFNKVNRGHLPYVILNRYSYSKKFFFPDGESNPGRGGESAES